MEACRAGAASTTQKVAELGLEVTPLLRTGEASWTREVPAVLRAAGHQRGAGEHAGPISPGDAGCVVSFPAPDPSAPAWPAKAGPFGQPPEPGQPEAPVEFAAAPERWSLLLGTARPFIDDAIVDPSGRMGWAGILVKNAVDALSLSDALLRLTLREPVSRPIRDMSRSSVVLYQVLIVGLAPAIYLALGITRLVLRRRRQEAAYGGRPAVATTGGEA